MSVDVPFVSYNWQKWRNKIQSTPVISKSKGPSETVRHIRTSTYQICRRIEENTNQTTKSHKWTCNLISLVRNICWKYCGKGEKLLLFSTIFCYLKLEFFVITRIRFSLRDKRYFEITEVEITITRVDCIRNRWQVSIKCGLSFWFPIEHWNYLLCSVVYHLLNVNKFIK